jgi:dTDP-4-amino-4,6-dideoxygalactose transaminase
VVLRDELPGAFLVRFTGQQAGLGVRQLMTVRHREGKRIENARMLYDGIENRPGLRKPDTLPGCENAFWLFPLTVTDTVSFRRHLARCRIDSSGYLLRVLSSEHAFRNLGFSAHMAKEVKRCTLFLPMYFQLDHDQVQRMVSAVRSYEVPQHRLSA